MPPLVASDGTSPPDQAGAIDPATGRPWAPRLDTKGSARYLLARHGLPVSPASLTRWRCDGYGPAWRYFGQKPLTTPADLDRFAETDALQPLSPLRRKPVPKQPATRKPRNRTARS